MDFHSLKRKELQALCKKHKIPANLTNSQMANRLSSLLKGEDNFFTGKKSCLKELVQNGSENEFAVENRRVKKVRFSPETQMFGFQKSEPKSLDIKRKGRRKPVINEVSMKENEGEPELSEKVEHIPRSRGRKLVAQVVAKRTQGKRGIKDKALGSNLPSANAYNEEGRELTRRSLRNREVFDEKKGENEVVENALKKKGRQSNVKGSDDVAERGEIDDQCVEVQDEKVLRRSKRNMTKVEDCEVLNNEVVARGKSSKKVDMAISEGSGSYGVDTDTEKAEKESSLIGVRMRRWRRNASSHEPLITLDNVIANANCEKKTRKRRRDPNLVHRKVLDEKKGENEVVENAMKKKGSQMNQRHGNYVKGSDDVAERGEIDVQCVEVQAEKVLRGSKRNVTKVEYCKLLKDEVVARGKSSKKVDMAISEGSGPSGVDIDAEKAEKESSTIGVSMRRSRRNASKDEPLITLDNVVANATCEKKTRKRRRHPNLEEGAVEVKSIAIELSPHNVNRSEKVEPATTVGGKVAQKEKRRSKKQTIEIENSVADGFLGNLKQQRSKSRKNSSKKSRPLVHITQDTKKKNSVEPSDDQEAHCPSKIAELGCSEDIVSSEKLPMAENVVLIDKSDSTDPKGIQISVELSFGKQKLRTQASVDHVVEDGGILSEKSGECIDEEGLETVPDDVLENYGNATSHNGPCERDGFSCEADPKNSGNTMTDEIYENDNLRMVANPNIDDDLNGTLNSGIEMEQIDPSLISQKNGGKEVDNVAGEGNFDHEELKCTESAEPNEHNTLEENCDASDLCCESGTPEPSGILASMLEDENANGGENSKEPADFLGKHFVSPSITAKERSDDERNGMGFDDVAEAEKHLEGVKNSALPKSDGEENSLEKLGQSDALDSYGCQLGMLDTNVGGDFVESQGLVLAAEDFSQQMTGGQNESWEDQLEKDGKAADLIESCRSETEKEVKKYGEPARSEVLDAAITSLTGNVVHIPTRDYTRKSITSSMMLDVTQEQDQSSATQMYCSKAVNIAEEDRASFQAGLNSNELAQSIENGNFEEKYSVPSMSPKSGTSHPPRSSMKMLEDDIFTGGEDSAYGLKNTPGSRPEKDEIAGVLESFVRKECTSAETDNHFENPVYSADAMAAIKCRTIISERVSVEQKTNESTCAKYLDITIEQREQSSLMHQNGFEAGSVAEKDWNNDQVELNRDKLSKSADDKPLEEQCHTPDKCWDSCIPVSSKRSARSMLQDPEDSTKQQKNAAGSPKRYEDELDKDENDSFIQSCVRMECASARKDTNYEENPVNSDDADSSSSETDSVAEVDRICDLIELKYDELSKSVEDSPREENHQFPSKFSESSSRSILQDSEDSMKCPKNTTSSRKTYEDEDIGLIDSCTTEKCMSAKNYDHYKKIRVNSEDPMETVIAGTGNFSNIPLDDINEHTGSMNSDMALDQREQSPIQQMLGFDAENGAEEYRGHDQVKLYCDKSAKCVEDKEFRERCHSPNNFLASVVSDSFGKSANKMLQHGVDNSCIDSITHQDKSYGDAPEEGLGGVCIESYVTGIYTTAKNHEDNPENYKGAMEAIIHTTENFESITVADNEEDYISTMNSEKTPMQREQSTAMQKNGCEIDNVAEDEKHENKNLSCGEFIISVEEYRGHDQVERCHDESTECVEDRSFGEIYHSPNECLASIVSDSSGRSANEVFQDEIGNSCEDSTKHGDKCYEDVPEDDRAGVSIESFVTGKFTTAKNYEDKPENSKEATLYRTGPPIPVVDSKEEIGDAMEQLTSVQRNIVRANDLNDIVDPRRFQEVVLDVQRRSSYVIEVDETFTEHRKTDGSEEISEKISDFSEAFQCIDKEDDDVKEENQVQFTFSEIQGEVKIMEENQDGVATEFHTYHEMLEESDVMDTINEYIDSESTRNALNIDILTKVVEEPEAQKAEETIDSLEPSIEGGDQEKGEAAAAAAELEEPPALGSAWISENNTAINRSKNSDLAEDKMSFLEKQFNTEMRKNKSRTILIHGTPKKMQIAAADMKENLVSCKGGKIGSLTTVKPSIRRPALEDLQ